MKNLIPPEGATDEQLEEFLESIRRDGRAEVRRLLLAGASEAEVAAYIASVGPEPEDAIAPPEGESIPAREQRPLTEPSDAPGGKR
jgi:hypothetical protein